MAILIRFLLEIVVGVAVVRIDRGANKLTIKGTNVDPKAIRKELEKKLKKKFKLVSPQPKKEGGGDKKLEEKKEVLKTWHF